MRMLAFLREWWNPKDPPELGQHIHVLAITTEYGQTVSTHLSLVGANEGLLEYVRSYEKDAWWPEDFLAAKEAGDRRGMIEAYFSEHQKERYFISTTRLQA